MRLRDLIEFLKTQPPDKVFNGFHRPHSYRGYYDELAFEPDEHARIGDMLSAAESALGKTFQGYKGGDYVMLEMTPVHIAEYGRCGEPITSANFKLWSAA